MNDTYALDTIDAALSGPAFCLCGEHLALAVHDDAAWLECPRFARPSRLPARLSGLTTVARELFHDRRFVVELPARPTGRPRTRPTRHGAAVAPAHAAGC